MCFLRNCRYFMAGFVISVIIMGIAAVTGIKVQAGSKIKNPIPTLYENDEDTFISEQDYAVQKFAYGRTSMGTLTLSGAIDQQTKYKEWNTYLADNTVSIGYQYNGAYQSGIDEEWHISSTGAKTIGNLSLSSKIKMGAVVIEQSADGENWENIVETENFFADNPEDSEELYSVSATDLKRGTYFRVMVAYQMTRKTGEKQRIPGWMPLIDKDTLAKPVYETIYCLEQYEFFLYYNGNPIILRDITSRAEIHSATVQSGFTISKDGWQEDVTVSANGRTVAVGDFDSFYEPGEYQIETITRLGKKISTNIQVTDGLKMTDVSPEVYVTGGGDNYEKGELETKSTPAHIRKYTTLRIGQIGSDDIEISKNSDDIPVYGITGNGVSLYLNLSGDKVLSTNGWEIVPDGWGKKSKQTIKGARTGKVLSGALIVQTSKTGKADDWKNVDKEKYADGLTTTDYSANWRDKKDVCIYTPSGEDVKNGIYIRVIYAYKAQKKGNKTSYRSYELYEFYLCNSELGSVSFHNLTVEGQIDELYQDEDENTVEAYRQAETLTSGSETVTGFELDTDLNPTATYEIFRNGKQVAVSSDNQYRDSGRYDVYLKSPAGNERNVRIYVDPQSNDEALRTYFGDSFLSGKRIYSTGSYPVYEGDRTSYHIAAVGEGYLPVSGQITNNSTGDSINISATREEKRGKLSIPGEYTCVFRTNDAGDDAAQSGDSRVFTFHFSIIAEGSAPGPVINQKNLTDYSHSSISDAYPVYYGLTYQSALKGRITLAFSSEESAIEYAYNYEKGTVEKQDDGTYRYTGSLQSQKESYDSVWNLTDDISAFAEKEVQRDYFDMSDEFTYRTLDEDTLKGTANLRTLELENSVIVFANEEEKSKLTAHKRWSLLSPKPYSYVKNPGGSETVQKNNLLNFQFIRDLYGIDSDKVLITDSTGKTFHIEYNKNVGEQLQDAGCSTGVVMIKESTKYGDTASYEAAFINPGDNTAAITVSYCKGEEKESRTFTQADDGTVLKADAFLIREVNDKLDPYDLVLVKKDGQVLASGAADEVMKTAWTNPGQYSIKVVNCLGYSYTVNVIIDERTCTKVMFSGEGCDSIQDMPVQYGQENILLPTIERTGYSLVGYEDTNGNRYSDRISKVDFKKPLVLTPQWDTEKCTVAIRNMQGNILLSTQLDYGSVYRLPDAIDGVEAENIQWSRDGVLISADTITVDDSKITLTISKSNESDKNAPEENDSSENQKSGNALPVVIFLVLSGALIYIGRKVRKRHSAECKPVGLNEDWSENISDADKSNV